MENIYQVRKVLNNDLQRLVRVEEYLGSQLAIHDTDASPEVRNLFASFCTEIRKLSRTTCETLETLETELRK